MSKGGLDNDPRRFLSVSVSIYALSPFCWKVGGVMVSLSICALSPFVVRWVV